MSKGKTLEKVLDAGPLPLEKAVMWATDLSDALSRAHRARVIHGDVKPANILVTKDGQVKLGDFGIARFATQVSTSGSLMGTPAYLSPEQIQGQTQDTRSDLFSLGIILYQMTTGVRPFNGSSVSAVCAQIVSITPPPPSHHNPSLPLAFDHVVMRCLAKRSRRSLCHGRSAACVLVSLWRTVTKRRGGFRGASSAINSTDRSALEVWAASAVQTLSASMKDTSRDFPATMARIFQLAVRLVESPAGNAEICGPRVQRPWCLISLVPIARALRNHAHQTRGTSVVAIPARPVASNPATRPPVTSNTAMINVSSSQTLESAARNTDAASDST